MSSRRKKAVSIVIMTLIRVLFDHAILEPAMTKCEGALMRKQLLLEIGYSINCRSVRLDSSEVNRMIQMR